MINNMRQTRSGKVSLLSILFGGMNMVKPEAQDGSLAVFVLYDFYTGLSPLEIKGV